MIQTIRMNRIDYNDNSLGLRPNGVSGSLVDGLMVKGFYFQLFQGTPPAQKLGAVDGPESLFRHFGAPLPDLIDFMAQRTVNVMTQ